MSFPLGLWDISLWLAISAAILLITSEMISPNYGKTNVYINRKRLRKAAIAVSLLFLVTVAIRVIGIILYP